MSSAEIWTDVLGQKVSASPEFIGHCIEKLGRHLAAAERWQTCSDAEFECHIELANTYSNALKALR